MSDLLHLDGICVRRDGQSVLEDINLRLGLGERLAIVGPNGAGKTTLLRTLVGLERTASGTIHLFGETCGTERQFRLHRPRIGFLFQDSDDQLFCPSVIEDVAFGPLNMGLCPAEAEKTARIALDGLGIAHLAERISHRLSGGEKRLVCLAGLMAMKPRVLLLDEPTNGIDAANETRLRDALAAYDGAMILVSHDTTLIADLATRAMVLEAGRLLPATLHSHAHTHVHAHVHAIHAHGLHEPSGSTS
ncbi:ABC transporter ATP-binding protein [Breoghania sp.]|uniref:energy-coupling factor ABC transporter ATP-binding protein n=1 Tax=Breoghania sp. TaxID=2065378 RepID=UPI002AAB8C8C|nr:ABC transporter ATP-binding protein [Breoghania sp.]